MSPSISQQFPQESVKSQQAGAGTAGAGGPVATPPAGRRRRRLRVGRPQWMAAENWAASVEPSSAEHGVATPEEARAANRELRARMRERDNYLADVERLAAETLDAVGYTGSGALSQRVLLDIAGHCDFSLRHVTDLPRSTRSVADLRHRRIYLGQANWIGGYDSRSLLLQALGHFLVRHAEPVDFAEYLLQRTEASYFAAAVLMPERALVRLLTEAKRERALAVDDLRDVYGVSDEMAAHRFTNLATRHLDLPVHFLRTDADGRI